MDRTGPTDLKKDWSVVIKGDRTQWYNKRIGPLQHTAARGTSSEYNL